MGLEHREAGGLRVDRSWCFRVGGTDLSAYLVAPVTNQRIGVTQPCQTCVGPRVPG
jgi:hypothetical protein